MILFENKNIAMLLYYILPSKLFLTHQRRVKISWNANSIRIKLKANALEFYFKTKGK